MCVTVCVCIYILQDKRNITKHLESNLEQNSTNSSKYPQTPAAKATEYSK